MAKNLKILNLLFDTFGFRIKYIILIIIRALFVLSTNIFLFLDKIFFPNFKKVSLANPIFLIGHPRSGTTFLHKFLVENCTDIRGMYLWEMLFPSLTCRILIKPFHFILRKISLDKVWDPKIHKTNLMAPETEDIALYFRFFEGLLSWVYFYIWENFKNDSEFEKNFLETTQKKEFIKYLKEIHLRNAFLSKKKILSKSFALIFNLDQIKIHFPDARILFIVREPLEAIPSFMSLERHVQNNLHKLGKCSIELQQKYYQSIYRTSLIYYKKLFNLAVESEHDDNILIITHKQIMRDFESTFEKIIDFYGLEKSEKLKTAIAKQVEKQKKFSSEHKYSLDEFGITKEQVHKDLSYIYEKFEL